MTTFQAIILGTLQGLTEFLPVSSTAHLRIFPALFGWGDPGTAFSAVIQLGTIAAVIIFFIRDLWRILVTWVRSLFTPSLRSDPDARIGWYILLGTLPIAVLGLLFQTQIETVFRSLWVVATTLILLGLVLWWADRTGRQRKNVDDLTLRDGLVYGFFQALALIPGVSRSGSTISAGLFLGYTREAAARYSFLLSVPAILASGIFQLKDISVADGPGLAPTLIATVVSFIVGYASIAWLLRYVSRNSYLPFVVYRIGLGVVVIVLLGLGVLQPFQ